MKNKKRSTNIKARCRIPLPDTAAYGRGMSSSDGAAITAQQGRGDKAFTAELDYSVHLPPLPTGRTVLNSVFLHADVKGRPYRVEDFRDALSHVGLLADVVSLGSYQMNHVWLVTFKSNESKKKLVETRELLVKDRRCLVFDPNGQNVRLKIHWVPHHVSDDEVRTALSQYGKVTEVTREKWRVQGCEAIESTTRIVLITLKAGVTVETLPHQERIAGGITLVVAPGRAPLCLKCHRTGHIRRECRTPRCNQCRRYGHETNNCVRSYAAVAGPVGGEDTSDFYMDEAEANEAGAPKEAVPESTPETTNRDKMAAVSNDKPSGAAALTVCLVRTDACSSVASSEDHEQSCAGREETKDITMAEAGTLAVKRTRETEPRVTGASSVCGDAEPPWKTVPGRSPRAASKLDPTLNSRGKGVSGS